MNTQLKNLVHVMLLAFPAEKKTEDPNVLLMNERPLTIWWHPFPLKQVLLHCLLLQITWLHFCSIVSVIINASGMTESSDHGLKAHVIRPL